MKRILLLVGLALFLLSGCGGGGDNDDSVAPATLALTEIRIEPTSLSLASGASKGLTAIAILADGTSKDVTEDAQWTSSSEHVATVGGNDEGGVVRALQPGQTVITATVGNLQGVAQVTVTATDGTVPGVTLESLTLSPASSSIPAGTVCTLTAMGRYSDGSSADLTSKVSWEISDANAARLQEAGKLRGLKISDVIVTAIFDGKIAQASIRVTAAVLVSLSITPSDAMIYPGTARNFHALGTYSDGSVIEHTREAQWSSSAPDVASTDNLFGKEGLVTADEVGTATIFAEFQGFKAEARARVTTATPQKLVINAVQGPFLPLSEYPFKAQCYYSDGAILDVTELVEWSSSDEEVAELLVADGKWGSFIAHIAGTARIIAKLEIPGKDLEATFTLTVE